MTNIYIDFGAFLLYNLFALHSVYIYYRVFGFSTTLRTVAYMREFPVWILFALSLMLFYACSASYLVLWFIGVVDFRDLIVSIMALTFVGVMQFRVKTAIEQLKSLQGR